MANLKDLRNRILSVKTTMQVTSAMKMVSAAKLRKSQNTLLQLRPYVASINDILTIILPQKHPLTVQRDVKKILLVVISSDRGLCGAFNSNLEKFTLEQIKSNNLTFEIIAFGNKIYDALTKNHIKPINPASNENIFSKDFFEKLTSELKISFLSEKYDQIDFIYHEFKSAGSFKLKREKFLPIQAKEKYEDYIPYILEPDRNFILERIIDEYLRTKVTQIFYEHSASEHAARMIAMHQATENAQEIIKELTLNYNKARQAAITKEIIEVVSGAEALKKQ